MHENRAFGAIYTSVAISYLGVGLVAPLIALSIGALGCVLADATDSPPAQMTVALLSLALVIAWLIRWLRHRATTA